MQEVGLDPGEPFAQSLILFIFFKIMIMQAHSLSGLWWGDPRPDDPLDREIVYLEYDFSRRHAVVKAFEVSIPITQKRPGQWAMQKCLALQAPRSRPCNLSVKSRPTRWQSALSQAGSKLCRLDAEDKGLFEVVVFRQLSERKVSGWILGEKVGERRSSPALDGKFPAPELTPPNRRASAHPAEAFFPESGTQHRWSRNRSHDGL